MMVTGKSGMASCKQGLKDQKIKQSVYMFYIFFGGLNRKRNIILGGIVNFWILYMYIYIL